jgi:5'-nucleotidase / UDP-sugar diphosphatase
MKRIWLFIFMMISLQLNAQTEKKLTILHTNDLHSHLVGFAPESDYTPFTLNDDSTKGGFSRIASIIKAEKLKSEGATLVLDAGDFMMGTLFPGLEKKTGFQLRLMKEMGYEVVGIGNHEYDFGPEWLASVIGLSAAKGSIPSILIGNAVFDKKDNRDDALEKELTDNLISRRVIIEKEGIKIGIFSILGKDAAEDAPNSKPVTFEKQTTFAKKMVKELKSEKCEMIICISHSGLKLQKDGKWGGEDAELARKVKGINLIVGGHSHTRLEQPLVVNGIPILQTGEFGQAVGCLSLTFSDGVFKTVSYKLIPVDDRTEGDENISRMIDEQEAKIDHEILQPLGISYNKPVFESDFVMEGNDLGDYVNSTIGPFIADAIYYYVNHNNTEGTDISMVAAGMIFDKIRKGTQTAPDIFRVMPLGSGNDSVPGYALSRLYVTGKELKSILEILQVAAKSKPDDYCYYSGMKAGYDPDKRIFKKIKSIEIVHSDGNTAKVDFSKKNKTLYSITADSYMLQFIGIIKKMSFGLINVVPKDAEGNKITDMKSAVIDINEKIDGVQEGKEWLALIRFIECMKDTNGNGMPDLDIKYSIPVRTFFFVKK